MPLSYNVLAFATIAAVQVAPAYVPTENYQTVSIQGFTVLFSPEIVSKPQTLQEVSREIEKQLAAITKAVPPNALSSLRLTKIWVEVGEKGKGAALFHPSAKWLIANGYNPDKKGAVEIGNTSRFLILSRDDQPALLLHELAHSYYFQFISQDDRDRVRDAFNAAVQNGSYKSVLDSHGNRRNAYAITNVNEYFSELSEALFNKNDFYPFVKKELLQHDPQGFAAVSQAWGISIVENK